MMRMEEGAGCGGRVFESGDLRGEDMLDGVDDEGGGYLVKIHLEIW